MAQMPVKQLSFGQKKILAAITFALALLLLKLCFFTPGKLKESLPDTSSKEILADSEPVKDLPAAPKATSLFTSYAKCTHFLQQIQTKSAAWGKKNYSDWTRYLQQGFSLDDITLAIEYFNNFNFAADFRIKQLRADTEYSQFISQINEQAKQMFPNVYQDENGLSFSKAIPTPALKNFANLSYQAQQTLLETTSINADDVAYFMGQETLSDESILSLLSHITELDVVVNYPRIEAISLLDYAVETMRPMVVEYLLQQGLAPSSDQYLGSTMEWALFRLSVSGNDSKAAKIVIMLQSYSAAARFTVKNNHSIQGAFPRRAYQFNVDDIIELRQKYHLDLTKIETRAALLIGQKQAELRDSSRPLIDLLKKQKAKTVTEEMAIADLPMQLNICEQKIAEIKKAWQPQNAQSIVTQIVEEYKNVPSDIIAVLAKIDPRLVDFYRTQYIIKKRKISPLANAEQYFNNLDNNNIQERLNMLLGLHLSDENKNYMFSQFLTYNTEFYAVLMHSELLVDKIEYASYDDHRMLTEKALNTLITQGAAVFESDSQTKTLVFYAAEKGKLALLRFMSAANFPFGDNIQGEDPLHVALSHRHYKFKLENLTQIVDLLMGYQPAIDTFHLKRMAVIKLQYPQIYQHIIAQHPQLKVSPDTTLPVVR